MVIQVVEGTAVGLGAAPVAVRVAATAAMSVVWTVVGRSEAVALEVVGKVVARVAESAAVEVVARVVVKAVDMMVARSLEV